MTCRDYERITPPGGLKKESPTLQAYIKGRLQVLVADEDYEIAGQVRLCKHLSISHPHRYPTWSEIKDARYRFMPRDLDGYMVFPRDGDYVNVHPNCFHIWMPLLKLFGAVK